MTIDVDSRFGVRRLCGTGPPKAVSMQLELGSTRALACSDRRLAGRNSAQRNHQTVTDRTTEKWLARRQPLHARARALPCNCIDTANGGTTNRGWLAWAFVVVLSCSCGPFGVAGAGPVRDVSYFLHRLRTVDHLPELEDAHTALASTWDRSGGNADGTDYKRIEGTTNILLDADGPGCIHRLFTGGAEPARDGLPGYLRVDGTRLQIFLDNNAAPLFDFPVVDFFDSSKGPVPSPLAGAKAQSWTYPGCLLPIPYARHCRVQLVNPAGTNWGCYWQIAYASYPADTPVESLVWPLTPNAKVELEAVRRTWLDVQTAAPAPPGKWTVVKTVFLAPGSSLKLRRSGAGVIREMRVGVDPATTEVLRGLRLVMYWNGNEQPSVDVPAGYFFGHAYSGHAKAARFSTLLLGVTEDEAYARFPMPYAKGAVVVLRNDSRQPIRLRVAFDIEKMRSVPPNWGLFHATYHEARAALTNGPQFGPKQVPGHLVLEHHGQGKYVGVLLREDWPHDGWWGEGDWLIWTDESGWPPRYHGTGSEEYFNSGWCLFDRKAVSGYVAVHPGHPAEYSFHLNDAFQFRRNIRVAVETMGWDKADQQIREEHPVWGSTAYWYGLGPGP